MLERCAGLIHQGKTDQYTQAGGLSSDYIQYMFEDREGNVWICTNSGIDRFRDFSITTVPVKRGLAHAYVQSVLPAKDGSVWLGTRNGLDRWVDGSLTMYRKRRSSNQGTAGEITESGLPDDQQGSLLEDHLGRIWFFSHNGASYLQHGQFVPVRAMPGGYAHAIAEDVAGDLWISQDQGLFHLHRGSVEKIPWARLGRQDVALSLVADPVRGGLWLGLSQGTLVYLNDGQPREFYTTAAGVGEGRINGIQLDRDGTVWAATEGGLSRVKDGRVVTLSSQNGLPCNPVHEVLKDDADSFWLYMACGLVRMGRQELDAWIKNPKQAIHATVFDSSDGLRLVALGGGLSPRVGKSTDGRLWYVSEGSVYAVDPRWGDRPQFSHNKLPPPVHIEQFTADGKTFWQNLTGEASPEFRLPPRVRDLAIDFTALSFVAPERIHFRFKLESQDLDWREVVNDRRVRYSNLAPGHYRFRVTASNNSGVWNETGAALDFSVSAAWYQTTWFRVSCAAAFLAMLWAVHQLSVRQLAWQFNMRLEERVSERTRIARDLHDTLLQSFHGLLLRFQAVSNLLPEGLPKQRLDGAINEASEAITEGRDAVQGLRSSTVEANDLALAIRAVGEELAANKANPNSVVFQVVVEGTSRNLHPILRDEVFRTAAEAMRNAFQHAQARKIEVEIRYDERQFRMRVRDDGAGIDPKFLNEEGRAGHFGLHGMRERAGLVGGRLAVWSELDSGTEVELSIPASIAYATSPARLRKWLAEKFSGKGTATKS